MSGEAAIARMLSVLSERNAEAAGPGDIMLGTVTSVEPFELKIDGISVTFTAAEVVVNESLLAHTRRGRIEGQAYMKREAFAGVEYEQVYSDLPGLIEPIINHVNVEAQDSASYRLVVSRADCTLDSKANPFFFFYATGGVFEDYIVGENGSASVTFRVDPGPGGRHAQVIAGVADGLGQIHRKSILLKGAD